MKCPRCKHENRLGAKFCEECAAPLVRRCTNCRAQLSPTAKCCSECAHPAGQAIPLTSQRFSAPESYTPKYLAERIRNSKAALEGERKQVTVLFADPVTTGTDYHPLLLAYLGEAHLLAGRLDDALAVARRALDLAHRQKERGNEAWALRLLGEIALHPNHPDLATAEAHFGAAMALASELGMRPLVAHCYLGLGKLHGRTGDRAKAGDNLSTGATMYREMDMRFWLEQAEADLRALA